MLYKACNLKNNMKFKLLDEFSGGENSVFT